MVKSIAQEKIFIDLIARKKLQEKDLRMDNENDILRHLVVAEKYDSLKEKKDVSKKYLHDSVAYHFKNKSSESDVSSIKKNFLSTLNKLKIIFGSRKTIASIINENKQNLNLTQIDILLIIFKEEETKFLIKYSDEILESFKFFFDDNTNRALIQNSKRGKNKFCLLSRRKSHLHKK